MAWHRGRGRGRGGGGASWRGRSKSRSEAAGSASVADDDDSASNHSFASRKRQRLTLNGVNSKTVTTARYAASRRDRHAEADDEMDAEGFEEERVMPVRLVSTRHGTKAVRRHEMADTCSDSTVGQAGHLGSSNDGGQSLGKRKHPPDPSPPMPGWMARAFEPEPSRSKKPRHERPHDERRGIMDPPPGPNGPSISQLADQYGWRAPSASLHHPSPLRPIPLDRFSSPSAPFVVYEDPQPRSESMPFRSSSSFGHAPPPQLIPPMDVPPPARHFSSPSSSLENHQPLGGSHSGSVRGDPSRVVLGPSSIMESYQPSVSPPSAIVPSGFWKTTPTMSEAFPPFKQPALPGHAVEANRAILKSGPSHESLYQTKLAAAAVQHSPFSHTGLPHSAPRHFSAPHSTSAQPPRPSPFSDSRLDLHAGAGRRFGDPAERSSHQRFVFRDPHVAQAPSFAMSNAPPSDHGQEEAEEELRELTRGWRPISLPDDFA